MQYFTPDQLIAWMDQQKCCKCNEKAKWLPVERGIAYCDEHYPYKEETEESNYMEWISVKDRLPEPYEFVLVFANTKGNNEPKPKTLARLLPGATNWEFLSEYEDGSGAGVYQDLEWPVDVEDITHWMPLPKPPKEY